MISFTVLRGLFLTRTLTGSEVRGRLVINKSGSKTAAEYFLRLKGSTYLWEFELQKPGPAYPGRLVGQKYKHYALLKAISPEIGFEQKTLTGCQNLQDGNQGRV
jgi:hypothetical protein